MKSQVLNLTQVIPQADFIHYVKPIHVMRHVDLNIGIRRQKCDVDLGVKNPRT